MKRFSIAVMVLGLTVGSLVTAEAKSVAPAHGATAEQEPARSGTIVSSVAGLHPDALIGCEMAVDCRAWLDNDCDPDLAGRDPALSASIEDVSRLAARSPIWILEHPPGSAAHADVQFWRKDCTEISKARRGSRRCHVCSVRLMMPASAKWMTVTGYTYNPWGVWLPIPHASGPLTLNWVLRQP